MKRPPGIALRLALASIAAWFGEYLAQAADLTITNVNQNVTSNSPFIPTGSPSQLSWAAINAALASGPVSVTTAGSPITGSDNIIIATSSPVMNSGNSLTISAGNVLTINSGSTIVNNGTGSLKLQGGTTVINTNIAVTGSLTIIGPIMLGSDIILTASSVNFNSTVDGSHNLTVNGSAFLTGAVGGAQALASLTLQNACSLN